jgi:hypothetical protein
MSATNVLYHIERKQNKLKTAIASDTREGLLDEEDRIRLQKLETFQKIYSYQDKTTKDLLQIGRFMLKTYDTYIALLNDILLLLQDYYFRGENGSKDASDVKKVADVALWYDKMKKLLIRFNAFTRGTTFLQFRLLFETFYEVKESSDVENNECYASGASENFVNSNYSLEVAGSVGNGFELWTEKFDAANVNRTSVKSKFTSNIQSGDEHSFFAVDESNNVASGISVNPANPFSGMSFDDIDLFQNLQLNALKQFSCDSLKLDNSDNTPYNVLSHCTSLRDEYLIFFDPHVLQEYIEGFKSNIIGFEPVLDEIVRKMVSIAEILYDRATTNRCKLLTQFYYIEITNEYACENLKFLQEEIEKLINVDADELSCMVENGNILKEKIRKLPCIGNIGIFSQNERSYINKLY